jgi:murein DD-endopeptidase MepM/ murein hydrolase activator NlpD
LRSTTARLLVVTSILITTIALSPLMDGASAGDREPTIATPKPERWMPSGGNKCRSVKGVKGKMCEGPRRVPEPYGRAALLAEELELGTSKTGHYLIGHEPKAEWVDAIEGKKKPTLLWPVENGPFGRGFGYTRHERKTLRHDGIDIGAEVGELVRSVNDGIVAYSDNEVSGYGNMVMVVHADASVSFYCHHRSNYVFAGQQVKRGQVLGEVGLTGITRGPHLHFEWHVNGKPRDPMPRMVGRPSRKGPTAMLDFWM